MTITQQEFKQNRSNETNWDIDPNRKPNQIVAKISTDQNTQYHTTSWNYQSRYRSCENLE